MGIYVWVVALIGLRCVCYDELNKGLVISHYLAYGELSENALDGTACQLNYLIENIINSRFIVN